MNRNRPLLPTVLLSVTCACLVILGRVLPSDSVLSLGPVSIPFTDFFFVISAGIGSLGSGLLSFVLVFIAEFIRFSGDMSLYAVSTYLIVVLFTASLSTAGWFKTVKKTVAGCILTTAVLAFCWLLTFTVVLPDGALSNTLYKGAPYWQLFVMALPETALAFAAVYLFYRKAPLHVRTLMANAWIYDPCEYGKLRKNQVLAQRITVFSMLETLILYVAALFCTNLLSAGAERTPFNLSYVLSKWQDNLRLALMMMCVGVPIAYLFNRFIMQAVVFPINRMSNYMDQYFAQQRESGGRHDFPDLNIRTGDEVERLYHSLRKMVHDMDAYVDHIIEQEQKTAHLTKDFMMALAKAVDAKDHYTSGHSVRVAQYSREIARRMGKTPEEQEDIYTLGLLHDIGKIGVPESIINKNGRLTDEEFKTIKEHPVMGYDILKNVKELPTLAVGARWHHERYDGRGYPDGLSGESIPLEARIIGVADAYDAMTSNRAYSSVRPQEQVRAEIVRCKGSQFDPAIADVMVSIMDDDKDYKLHE